MRFSSSRPAATHWAAAMSDRRRRGPSRYPIDTVNALLAHHPDPHLGLHLGVEANGNLVDAERLEGLVELDGLLVHAEALGLEAVGDVAGGHGAEELVALAGLHRERERHGLEPRRDVL